MCVVAVRQTFKAVLDYLETGEPAEKAETARDHYFAASRAQRLFVIAAPQSRTARLATHIRKAGAQVDVVTI